MKLILISEFVTINEHQYVVKVKVVKNNTVIATGLAADTIIEKAEDRARERALAVIDLGYDEPKFSEVKAVPSPIITDSGETPETKPDLDSPKFPQSSKDSSSSPSSFIEVSQKDHIDVRKESLTVDSSTSSELPLIKEESLDSHNLSSINSESKEQLPLNLTHSESENDDPEILNWSDLINRINIELKRLNWTQDQGRNYLLETYGKKTRHLLTDQELIEFLAYLETL